MAAAYQQFIDHFLNPSGREAADGCPVELIDKLTPEEALQAEKELIKRLSCWRDDWPIIGLGHMRSEKALPQLRNLLKWARGATKAQIATAIWKIAGDDEMVNVVIRSSRASLLSSLNHFGNFR